METARETLASIILKTKASLTLENWRKVPYFQADQGQLYMCAHGALQAIVNPEVKAFLRSNMTGTDLRSAARSWAASGHAPSTRASWAEAAMRNNPSASPQEIWDLCSSWARSDYIYNGKNYGKSEAHYLLGMVGLTAIFNDATDTTFEMIQQKFGEAHALAL